MRILTIALRVMILMTNVIIHENKYNDDGGGADDYINLHLINLNSVMRECDS